MMSLAGDQALDDHINGQILSFARELHRFLDDRNDAVPFTKQPPAIPDHIMFPDQMTLDPPKQVY